MRLCILLFVFLCAGLVFGEQGDYAGFADPSPPNITKQFIANYTLGDPSFNTTYTGYIAVDYINGGGVFNLNGIAIIPVYISTTFTASPYPENDTISLYWYYGDLCYNLDTLPLEDVTLFPLAIPPGSDYEGDDVIRGATCSKWSFESTKFRANVTMWVDVKQSTVARIDLEYDGDTARWDFVDTAVGPFNPDIYSPPKMDCPDIWSSFEDMELPWKTIINLLRL